MTLRKENSKKKKIIGEILYMIKLNGENLKNILEKSK